MTAHGPLTPLSSTHQDVETQEPRGRRFVSRGPARGPAYALGWAAAKAGVERQCGAELAAAFPDWTDAELTDYLDGVDACAASAFLMRLADTRKTGS